MYIIVKIMFQSLKPGNFFCGVAYLLLITRLRLVEQLYDLALD